MDRSSQQEVEGWAREGSEWTWSRREGTRENERDETGLEQQPTPKETENGGEEVPDIKLVT